MAYIQLLLPVTDPKGTPLTAQAPDGRPRPVVQVAPDSPLTEQIHATAASSFVQEAVRLDRYARTLALREGSLSAAVREHLAGPVCLLLSQEEGGFARHGFWLQGEDGSRTYIPVSYIDMVVDPTSLERGGFESTFAHELAHTQIRLLVGDITSGPCRKMHQSHAVTDYPTALDEGWAEHFEPVVRDRTGNPWLLGLKKGRVPDLLATWMSNVDGALRQEGVRRNLFVHRKPLPARALEADPGRFDLFMDGETSGAFLQDQLKNGQAMLACEGVGATLFYRMVGSEPLRGRYREAAFYQRFLADADLAGQPEERFTPFENIYLKLFAALFELGRTPLCSTRPYLAELVQAYATLFPDEAETVYQLFVELTWGATVSWETARSLEALAQRGRMGDIAAFQRGVGPAVGQFEQLRGELLAGRAWLDGALGPELWVLNDQFLIPRPFWSRERTVPLTVNLNTAAEHELMTLPGVDLNLARRIVAARHEAGCFAGLAALEAAVPETAPLMPELKRMARLMAAAGEDERL